MLPVILSRLDNYYTALKPQYRPEGDPDREAVRAQCKIVPGCTWDRTKNAWVGPTEVMKLVVERLERAKVLEEGVGRWFLSHARVPPTAVTFNEGAARDGKKPFEYQLDGIHFLLSSGRDWGAAILGDEMGTGKQCPNDSLVLTPEGWRTNGNIRVGDYVTGSDGKPTRVIGVYPQGVQLCYRVTFSDGSSAEAGPEHLWTMRYRKAGRTWADIVLTTKELRDRGKKGTIDLAKTALYLPMLTAPVQYAVSPYLPIEPYLLGALIANGALHNDCTLTVNAVDWPEVRQRIPAERYGRIEARPGCVRMYLRGLRPSLRALKLDVLSGDKYLPRAYMLSAPEARMRLLQGLMDGDGTCQKNGGLRYSTSSARLADDVRELVESLGGIAKVKKVRDASAERGALYDVRLRLPRPIRAFTVSRKAARDRRGSHSIPTRTLVSVEATRTVSCTCLAVEAADRLYAVEHAILTHNTVQSGRALEANLREGGKALIVCPAVVLKHWEREIQNWTSLSTVRLGAKRKKKDGGGRITNWEQGEVALVSFDTFRGLNCELANAIVIDELHYVSNPKAARSKKIREYITACRDVMGHVIVYGLTGTPINSSTKDLWNPLDLLFPKRFGTKFQFEQRYADGGFVDVGLDAPVWQADGKSNLEELGERLQHFMLRRVKSEVLSELPPLQRILFPVEMPEKAKKNLSAALASISRSEEHVGRALSHIEEYKLDAAVDLAKDLIANGKRPLLFTLRKESAKALAEQLRCPFVTGDTSADKRVDILSAGTGPGVATIYSMTTGVNLTMFDTIVFVGLDWIPSTLLQAEGRIHRPGQVNSVTYYYMIGLHTADEIVRERVLDRLETFATVIGNAASESALKDTLDGQASRSELLESIVFAIQKMNGEV